MELFSNVIREGQNFKNITFTTKQVLWVHNNVVSECMGCKQFMEARIGQGGMMICYHEWLYPSQPQSLTPGGKFQTSRQEKCTHPQFLQDPRVFSLAPDGSRLTTIPDDLEL